ncbi:MAG: hypothetical protein QOK42_2164 [Frankiaceae bacterium]|nr:hypothetical protein [Frankiaceae bacterium]
MTTARFEQIVDEYDAARPDYPGGVYDALSEAVGGLSGRRVVEVGAGTGIATRQLVERGAQVVAVELGENMLRRLVERSPAVSAVRARGEALPLIDGSADLVCAAQAWHWVDPVKGVAEAARVLRPGGAFAAWWNSDSLPENPWVDRHNEWLDAHNPAWRVARRRNDDDWLGALEATGFQLDREPKVFRWTRVIALDRFIQWLASKSYVHLAQGRDDFLAAERLAILKEFPDGLVTENFATALWVARRTS